MVQSKSSDPTTSFRKQTVVSSKVQLRGSVLGDGVVMGIANNNKINGIVDDMN